MLVKLQQRDARFAGNVFIATASTGSKSANEALQTYLESVYTDQKHHMKAYDKAMENELELMLQVDWKSVLSVPEGIESLKGHVPQTGEGIEEVLK